MRWCQNNTTPLFEFLTVQADNSILNFQGTDHQVTLYKGHGLAREAEDYLASHGLKSAMYSIYASDVQEDLFGQVVPCPFRVRCFFF